MYTRTLRDHDEKAKKALIRSFASVQKLSLGTIALVVTIIQDAVT